MRLSRKFSSKWHSVGFNISKFCDHFLIIILINAACPAWNVQEIGSGILLCLDFGAARTSGCSIVLER